MLLKNKVICQRICLLLWWYLPLFPFIFSVPLAGCRYKYRYRYRNRVRILTLVSSEVDQCLLRLFIALLDLKLECFWSSAFSVLTPKLVLHGLLLCQVIYACEHMQPKLWGSCFSKEFSFLESVDVFHSNILLNRIIFLCDA